MSSSRPTAQVVSQGSIGGAPAGGSGTSTDPMDFNPSRVAAFSDSKKQKEQDLKSALSSRMVANLSKVVHDTENGVEEKEWEE